MSLIGLSGVTAMAGIPAGLPAGVRVSDHISLGVIAQAFPPDRVQQVLAEIGKASERERDLPAQVMVYYAIAMALYMGSSTREVLRCLLGGLRWLWGADAVKVAGKADGQATALSKLPAHPFGNLPQPRQGSGPRRPPAGDLEQISAFIRCKRRVVCQAPHQTISARSRAPRFNLATARRKDSASAVLIPCHSLLARIRAKPSDVRGPVLGPPCIRQRPLGIGALRHECPARVRAPQQARTGLSARLSVIPPSPALARLLLGRPK